MVAAGQEDPAGGVEDQAPVALYLLCKTSGIWMSRVLFWAGLLVYIIVYIPTREGANRDRANVGFRWNGESASLVPQCGG